MKFLLIIIVVFVAVNGAPQQYTTKYDNVDLNEILKSDRLLRNYVNCLLSRGRCSPDGQELKLNIGDAILTDCRKCSEKQRNGSKTVIRYLLKNKRHWWNELEAKYDPARTYVKRHAKELRAEGVAV